MNSTEIDIQDVLKDPDCNVASHLSILTVGREFERCFVSLDIKSAEFEIKPPNMFESRIKTQNKDNSFFIRKLDWPHWDGSSEPVNQKLILLAKFLCCLMFYSISLSKNQKTSLPILKTN